MSKDKQALGAPAGEHQIIANNADELLAELAADSKKKSDSKKKKKIEDYKVVQATREMLINRKGQVLNVPVVIDNETAWNFKVRRISEAENSDILDRTLAVKRLDEMTHEELDASNEYNFRLLALSVVEPELTAEEWESTVDAPLARKIVEQISKVITDVNANGIFDDFQK